MKRLLTGILSPFLIFCMFCSGNKLEAAQAYPVKHINFIVPGEAGSDVDIMSRSFVERLSPLLGQPIMIVNKPGAGSSIGYREVYGAKPDGYTIGSAPTTIVANKLQGISPFDHRDLSIMGTFYSLGPTIVASTKTKRPFKTIEEVVAFAKSHPGEVSISCSAVGNLWWIATMAFQAATGLDFNVIPQPGAAAFVVTQVAGGHTDLGVLALPSAKPQIVGGNFRLLAVFTPQRVAKPFDNFPTLKELGYDAEMETTCTLIGPPKMPKDIVDKLAKASEKAVSDPAYQKFAFEKTVTPIYLSPDKALQYLDKQRIVYRSIMEKAGILKEK
jgi:tripartite-type tricarboxylate transporter receptor subunit TctC